MPEQQPHETAAGAERLRRRVGENLRRLREAAGLTQEQLAHASGIASRHVQKLEGGTVNFTVRTIARVSTALSVDAADLFRANEERP